MGVVKGVLVGLGLLFAFTISSPSQEVAADREKAAARLHLLRTKGPVAKPPVLIGVFVSEAREENDRYPAVIGALTLASSPFVFRTDSNPPVDNRSTDMSDAYIMGSDSNVLSGPEQIGQTTDVFSTPILNNSTEAERPLLFLLAAVFASGALLWVAVLQRRFLLDLFHRLAGKTCGRRETRETAQFVLSTGDELSQEIITIRK